MAEYISYLFAILGHKESLAHFGVLGRWLQLVMIFVLLNNMNLKMAMVFVVMVTGVGCLLMHKKFHPKLSCSKQYTFINPLFCIQVWTG